ncbi:MAG: membrane protein insertion efficiency factor YidD [Bdellovibrionales bacterium]|nr:membrane protein insertion efficiency factor YidD [Bdellovibrionales bacterium]
MIRSYQVVLSPLLGGACRFNPSCSHYAIQAFEILTPWEAIKAILKRLSQCHPWGPFGEDPIRSKEIPS